jgi:3-hydroxyacyl-CoA dehydrogenase / enoyl-CoA hydratase / 3-hydroxybutyryl-CoA epimerase
MSHLRLEIAADNIAVVTLDVAGAVMNTLSPAVIVELSDVLDRILAREDVRGIIVTSAKPVFAAGWDLADLLGILDAGVVAKREAFVGSRAYGDLLRRLETCGKPVAAAVNGLALGGGLELALACHYRVLADDPSAVVGVPEVKVGLLPGAGGTQRLPRLIGIEKALPLLLEGRHLRPAEALQIGIVHELAPAARVVDRARLWLQGQPDARAPWDRKGFQVPGGNSIAMPSVGMTFMMGSALVAKSTLRNLPAPTAILSAAFEGLQVPIDVGLTIEGKYFAKLIADPVARNLVRTLFINKGHADRLVRRPSGVVKSKVTRLGILGAGMMGAGIAHVSALAGIECVLLDRTRETAERGKLYSSNVLERSVEKGRITQQEAAAVLARIRPTESYSDLAGCDLVIEAVFEDRDIKARVTQQAEAILAPPAVFASNTSTLPISGLAAASRRQSQFIGIHFFSPVERMPLVEVIVGKQTGPDTLARALDYVGQLRKTPIVVNDSRGFYTSRVFGTYCNEGRSMLEEGIEPALIENAGRFAGMPVGPLAVADEVSLELQYKVVKQTQADLGEQYPHPTGWNVLRHFVEDLGRLGRKSGSGYYEYPQGAKKVLWSGLAREYPRLAQQPALAELQKRLLYIQALETARCFDEKVLTDVADADLGSILGWGFPAHTGGTLSFIDTMGVANFVAECQRLASVHGPRFAPPPGLIERANLRQRFHPVAPRLAAQGRVV